MALEQGNIDVILSDYTMPGFDGRTALGLATNSNLHSIAFPAISTGVYRFPADLAARTAMGTVVREISAPARGINRVVFCCFSNESADHHINAFRELGLA